MTDKEYKRLLVFKNMQGAALIPENQNAIDRILTLKRDELIYFKDVTKRDISLHNCYFALLRYAWGLTTPALKAAVPCDKFHDWMKYMKDQIKWQYRFNDGVTIVEYESISFSRMDNNRFKDYIREQMPALYEVFCSLYNSEYANMLIQKIEIEFERMFAKL